MFGAKPDLSASLESGLKQAIQSYETFKTGEVPSDAKGFTAYHNACKSALMHIALLMKLLQGNEQTQTEREPDWLGAARAALTQEADDDDDLFSA